ncbi:hypothetical protein EVAR_52985_1 [Eumeta japonica]|uniref:Uncharacterized protein n=1 Tax=Eumeta variegata TaxID=151549 RepID=A0A4C1Z667_EUMVA|nr:hypothetical protein EVAR_52985_1 [Eumeta japonica]
MIRSYTAKRRRSCGGKRVSFWLQTGENETKEDTKPLCFNYIPKLYTCLHSAGEALVTLQGLRVFMGDSDHGLSTGPCDGSRCGAGDWLYAGLRVRMHASRSAI